VSYELRFKGSARKEFMRLPAEVRAEVSETLDLLEQNPRPVGVEALVGPLKGLLRVRVGKYRIVYQADDEERRIVVTRVRHRGKVYRSA
jgi:mRNA interferase RelE/StbE